MAISFIAMGTAFRWLFNTGKDGDAAGLNLLLKSMSLLGYISYNRLSVELLPNAELPMLFVQIASPSAVSPQYLEQQGVIPVEGAIGTLEGVEEIDSRISGNRAFIQVSFKQGIRFKYVFLKLQQKINQIR